MFSIMQDWRQSFSGLARVAFGMLFVASGLAKFQQPYDFLADVYSYELVGPSLGYQIALWLPWIEFVLGVCLIAGIFPEGGLLLTTVLMVVFTAVKTSAVHRDLQIGCGCQVLASGATLGIRDVVLASAMTLASGAAYAARISLRNRGDHDTSGSREVLVRDHPAAALGS